MFNWLESRDVRHGLLVIAATCIVFIGAYAVIGSAMAGHFSLEMLLIVTLVAPAFCMPALAFRAHSREKQRADTILEIHNQRLNAVLENMSQGFCMFDADRRLVLSNNRYAEIYGYSPDEIAPGTHLDAVLRNRVAHGAYDGADPAAYIEERQACVEGNQPKRAVHELPDGRILAVSHTPMPDGGWLSTHDDITEFQKIRDQVAYMAHYDPLTDLPNRRLFREKVSTELQEGKDANIAVMCLDLDHFKRVNDTLGHPVGDMLLAQVAGRLRDCVGDRDVVARLGGDEFAILQISSSQPEHATGLAHRISDVLSEPFDLDGHQVITDASIGIAIAPADGEDPDTLLKNADMALDRAKSDGRGLHRFFEIEMDRRMRERRQLEIELRNALPAGQFELYYQPLLSAQNGDLVGFEALLRWNHPERGMVSPADFIPLAEEIGVIVPIGDWVIRQACQDAMCWPDGTRVAVNLSAMQFKNGNLVPVVLSALSHSGLDAGRLELEITETILLQDNEATLQTLHMLRNLGARIVMDDFGTGYSSLSYLRSFPFDKIKIDRSFIRDLAHSPDVQAIVRTVASLGASLGIATTAEGVETVDQFRSVRAEGYTEIQGYLCSRPRPAKEIAAAFSHSKEHIGELGVDEVEPVVQKANVA